MLESNKPELGFRPGKLGDQSDLLYASSYWGTIYLSNMETDDKITWKQMIR